MSTDADFKAAAPKGTISFTWSPDVKTVMVVLSAAAAVLAVLIKEWLSR